MKKLLLALALLFVPSIAWAQCNGAFPNNTVCGNLSGGVAPPTAVPTTTLLTGGGIFTSQKGVSGSGQTTTGTITAGQATLTMSGAIDFQNSQGILVNHAGAASLLAAPTALSVTPSSAGITTYQYWVSACDGAGGYGPPATVTINNGPAQLGTGISNSFAWTSTAQCFLIWRKIGSGATAFLTSVSQSPLVDVYFSPTNVFPVPFWATATPPTSGAADWLLTTVSTGGGTASLTLGSTATMSASVQTVQHDDTTAMNAWIAALNASCSSNGFAVPNSTIRVTASLTAFTCSNTIVDGQGSTILGGGSANNSVNQYVLSTGGIGTGATTVAYCMRGSATLTVTGTSSFTAAPGFVDIFSPSPGNAQYDFETKYFSNNATQVWLEDSCPTNFYDWVELDTLGGTTYNSGDVMSINMSSTSFSPTFVAVIASVFTGDTSPSMVDKLAVALNGNTTLQAANVNAWHNGNGSSSDSILYIGWPHNDINTVSFTTSKTGTGNETQTLTRNTSYSSVGNITYNNSGFVFQNWNIDGSSIGGGGGAGSYNGLLVEGSYHGRYENLNFTNFTAGAGLFTLAGQKNIYAKIRESQSGNPGYFGLSFSQETRALLSDIASDNSNGFAVGLSGMSWLNANNIQISGSTFRCFKTAGSAQANINGLSVGSCGDTGVSVTWGTVYYNFNGATAGGAVCGFATSNSQGIWTSNDFNRFNQFFGANAFGACSTGITATNDIATFTTDTSNSFYGAQYGTIGNAGNAALH